MNKGALIGVYLAALLVGLLLFNVDAENNWVALGIWCIVSAVVGWSLARWSTAILPFASLPMALPFGYADEYLGSDAPYVWWFALVASVIAAGVVLTTTGARKLYVSPTLSANAMRKLASAVLFALAGATITLAGLSLANLWDRHQESPDSAYITVAAVWLAVALVSIGAGVWTLRKNGS